MIESRILTYNQTASDMMNIEITDLTWIYLIIRETRKKTVTVLCYTVIAPLIRYVIIPLNQWLLLFS